MVDGEGVVVVAGPVVSLRRCARARLNSNVGLTGWVDKIGGKCVLRGWVERVRVFWRGWVEGVR